MRVASRWPYLPIRPAAVMSFSTSCGVRCSRVLRSRFATRRGGATFPVSAFGDRSQAAQPRPEPPSVTYDFPDFGSFRQSVGEWRSSRAGGCKRLAPGRRSGGKSGDRGVTETLERIEGWYGPFPWEGARTARSLGSGPLADRRAVERTGYERPPDSPSWRIRSTVSMAWSPAMPASVRRATAPMIAINGSDGQLKSKAHSIL